MGKVAYGAALASGNVGGIERYKWAVDAAIAAGDIWCAGMGR